MSTKQYFFPEVHELHPKNASQWGVAVTYKKRLFWLPISMVTILEPDDYEKPKNRDSMLTMLGGFQSKIHWEESVGVFVRITTKL